MQATDRENLPRVVTGKNLLSAACYQKSLYELKYLVSVTPEDYQTLYVQVLENVAVFMPQLPHPEAEKAETNKEESSLLMHALRHAITVLKRRRAYMLPRGADAETCYKQQDVWTYALFTAALLQRGGQNMKLAETLLPAAAFRWLQQWEVIWQEWQAFLKGEYLSSNTLAWVILGADPTVVDTPPVLPIVTLKEELAAIRPQKESVTPLPPVAAFIDWLQQAITQHTLLVNKPNALIYRVAEGILLVMPELYHLFLKQQPDIPPADAIYTEQGYDVLVTHLVDSDLFKRTAAGYAIYHYDLKISKRSQHMSGMLIEPHHLFSADNLPPVATDWQMNS